MVFDNTRITQPCVIGAGVIATTNSVTFDANMPGSTMLTVSGNLETPTLTINNREAAGNEIQITANASITVTSIFRFQGGNVSGSGQLNINAPNNGTALVQVDGIAPADQPTLGCALVLSTSATGETTMDFGSGAFQPMVVTGNASITVNSGATLNLEGVCKTNRIGVFMMVVGA